MDGMTTKTRKKRERLDKRMPWPKAQASEVYRQSPLAEGF